MTDDDRKFLTEAMGECWHEMVDGVQCSCGAKVYDPRCVPLHTSNRTFTTWEDFGAVWEWANRQEWWDDFIEFCWKIAMSKFETAWFVVDTILFPKLVVQFLKEQK